jgi:hypothetical protein
MVDAPGAKASLSLQPLVRAPNWSALIMALCSAWMSKAAASRLAAR